VKNRLIETVPPLCVGGIAFPAQAVPQRRPCHAHRNRHQQSRDLGCQARLPTLRNSRPKPVPVTSGSCMLNESARAVSLRVQPLTPALRFGDPRVMALTGALCQTLLAATGFTNKNLRVLIAGLLGSDWPLRADDLRPASAAPGSHPRASASPCSTPKSTTGSWSPSPRRSTPSPTAATPGPAHP
jgi:hypothetical protein